MMINYDVLFGPVNRHYYRRKCEHKVIYIYPIHQYNSNLSNFCNK